MQFDSVNERYTESAENEQKTTIQELQKALADEKAKGESNLQGWQRAQADFINFKRNSEKEKLELNKFACVGLLVNILPVIDDFERALEAVPASEVNQKWLEGMKLIDRKFRDVLEKQGLSRISTLGEKFDHNIMEAMASSTGARDTVLQELEKGYKLQDKVIRPAKVIVGSGEEVNKEE